ncbi:MULTISPECIES: hydantoinase B/oxoprolinase family protein [Ramlibacter]|uniref:Hydantoinase B/oxoprolinase family protein n=1 Tax=Ramlibacter pinisoli TaxID=2682844 RepID=A0A6N8IZ09_9BURK|nr:MULTISPECIES: hydantoinase B/oxoprolinase family protein [Ramlibacter]MBA2962282.1 hydantoinase B/oxoprolinase family protein [Ramlibacter sp. CGMCC 1.13660]MVQ32224.1 hydantoinase B/oxoprolinase family protein [Ramlibacter pinisoli]
MNARVESLDPITLEVIRNKLEGIANEMQMTLLHSAFSPIVKEGMDCSAAVFTADGQTMAQATAIPIHLATMIPALHAVLHKYPVASMAPGDVYLLNDPYCGGTHLPDITLFVPVYADGRVVAFSVSTVHHQDMGGMAPGSIPTNATEIYQEGLRLPPLKYMDAGRENETLREILRLNIRLSDTFFGDLHAQLAACRVGERRLTELCASYGAADIERGFGLLLDRSEAMTRNALRQLPEGTFHYVDWLDNDGVELDRKVRLEVAVTVRDGTIHFDFTGTDPQLKGPLNCVPSGAQAAAYYAVRALTDASIPTNGGCFRPVTLHLPEGSLVNPVAPAPVNARTATIKRMCGMMVGALAEAVPERVPAASASVSTMLAFGGRRPDGSSFIVSELVAAGTGASQASDGVDCLQTDGSNSMNLPLESLSMDVPVRVLRFGLRPDSGGAGRHRGGLGVVKEYEFLVDGIRFTYRGERHFTQARGSRGGGAGAMARATIHRADGRVEQIPSKTVTELGRGDRLLVETAGGGGFGAPQERPREQVLADLRNGKVSPAAARETYAQTGL